MVEVDKGEAACAAVADGAAAVAPKSNGTSDFWFRAGPDQHIYLEPRNGVRLTEPNSADTDCRHGVYRNQAVRVDGLGRGSDLCLISNAGRYSHVFFMAEIEPDAGEVSIYYMTRK